MIEYVFLYNFHFLNSFGYADSENLGLVKIFSVIAEILVIKMYILPNCVKMAAVSILVFFM